MKNLGYVIISIMFLFVATSNSRVIFADNTLQDLVMLDSEGDSIVSHYNFIDTLFGTNKYNPDSRKLDGNKRAYGTLFHAFLAMNPGDTVLMRGGEYTESFKYLDYRVFSADKQGWIMSYPNEWAKLKGSINYRAMGGAKFLNFERFEIDKGHITIARPKNMTFKELYIHDNPPGVPGDEYINSGIVFWNDDGAAQNNKITKCWLINNGNANIKFFGDYYGDPLMVDSNIALSRNEISYNYLDGSTHGIHYKNLQFLSRDNTGEDMSLSNYGDKIHHNIITNVTSSSLYLCQDFLQVYNNVFYNVTIDIGEAAGSKREPFHVYCYNNLFVNSIINVNHNNLEAYNGTYIVNTGSGKKLHPYFNFYNNVLKYDQSNSKSLRIITSSAWSISDFDISSISIEKNLFYPAIKSDKPIMIGSKTTGNYSLEELTVIGVSKTENYSSNNGNLFMAGKKYELNPSAVISSKETKNTIGTAGLDANHKYLSNIKIPSYIGPIPPNSPSWLDSLLPGANIKGVIPLTKDALPIKMNDMHNTKKQGVIQRQSISGNSFSLMGRQLGKNQLNLRKTGFKRIIEIKR